MHDWELIEHRSAEFASLWRCTRCWCMSRSHARRVPDAVSPRVFPSGEDPGVTVVVDPGRWPGMTCPEITVLWVMES
jgi:hypothetical protein